MKKINLKGVSETLSEREMKDVMGGNEEGTMTGYECHDSQCYVDIDWDDGSTECAVPMPMEVCERFAGFTC